MQRTVKIGDFAYQALKHQSLQMNKSLTDLATAIISAALSVSKEGNGKGTREKMSTKENKKSSASEEVKSEDMVKNKGEEYSEDGVRIYRDFTGKIISFRKQNGEEYNRDGVRIFSDGHVAEKRGELWKDGKRIF